MIPPAFWGGGQHRNRSTNSSQASTFLWGVDLLGTVIDCGMVWTPQPSRTEEYRELRAWNIVAGGDSITNQRVREREEVGEATSMGNDPSTRTANYLVDHPAVLPLGAPRAIDDRQETDKPPP